MKRKFKYIEVKNGVISTIETNDFNEVIKDTYGSYYNYESSDWIFDENLDIRVFVEKDSLYKRIKETIYFYSNETNIDVLKGTVLFAKNGNNNWKALSGKDVKLIYKKLKPSYNHTFTVNY